MLENWTTHRISVTTIIILSWLLLSSWRYHRIQCIFPRKYRYSLLKINNLLKSIPQKKKKKQITIRFLWNRISLSIDISRCKVRTLVFFFLFFNDIISQLLIVQSSRKGKKKSGCTVCSVCFHPARRGVFFQIFQRPPQVSTRGRRCFLFRL